MIKTRVQQVNLKTKSGFKDFHSPYHPDMGF